MKKFIMLAGVMAMTACGSGGNKAENSELGSLEVKTSLPTGFLPVVSKVEILALAKGEQDESKAAVFTLPLLNSKDAAISLAAGEYEFAVKVYHSVDGKDAILARSIKDNAECPNVAAAIKGGTKTQIAISVCMSDSTKPIDTSGTGSGSFEVSVKGFLPLLNCTVESKVGAENNYKSLGIEAKLDPDNKASAFRMVVGQANAAGIESYTAKLKLDPNYTPSSSYNTKFQVLNQAGVEIGTFLLRASSKDYALAYNLTMNDGNKATVTVSDPSTCAQVVPKPVSFSLYDFFRGL